MKYLIFDNSSEELIDIVNFSDIEKIKYEKLNPNHHLELESDVLGDNIFDDENEEDFFDYLENDLEDEFEL